LARATAAIATRIVLITPAERPALPDLKAAGFTGYLVKPVRAASLAARLGSAAFDRADIEADIPVPATTPIADGMDVLVAEDNEINALLARALLERLGHRATVVTTGDAAVETWQRVAASGAPFDLVLMDVHMPGSDGIAATRRIRAQEAERGAAPTPIIALTANAFDEDRDACRKAGMDGFLTKPLDRERLSDALRGMAERKALAA
jgi:CheY-like chemotaxis protein